MKSYRERVVDAYKVERAKNLRADRALMAAKYEVKYGDQSPKRNIMPSRYEAYDGEEVTDLPNGWKLKVEFLHDSDHEPPWESCDGTGVIEGNPRYGLGDEYKEWALGDYRYFDWKATLPIAIKEGWDAPPYHTGTKHEQAMRAMRSTYDYLRRWCNDQWWYVGMTVTLLDEDDTILREDSCWGYESDSMDYLTSEARGWAARLICDERAERRESLRTSRIASRFRDAMECGL